MKNNLHSYALLCLLIAGSLSVQAQAPQSLNYQAVARNAGGNVIPNQLVGIRFSIHDASIGGTVVFKETDTATTNKFGLFTTAIGTGNIVTGTFAAINWAGGSKYLQMEIDPAGASNYTDMGTTQLLSVPYALYAQTSGSGGLTGATGATGPTGATGFLPSGSTPGNTPYWNGTQWVANSSNIYNDGANIGINTISPVGKLHIKGSSNISQLVIDADSGQSSNQPLILLRAFDTIELMRIHADLDFNTFAGKGVGQRNTGAENTFIGAYAGSANMTGANNTGIGAEALAGFGGDNNTAVGMDALEGNAGSYNIAIGTDAMNRNEAGNYNIAIGSGALYFNSSGSQNIAIGLNAMGRQICGTSCNPFNGDNVAIGYDALYENYPTANTNGVRNTTIGDYSMYENTIGYDNAALGYNALYYNTTGTDNTAIGSEALYNNTGEFNTGVGEGSLFNTTSSQYNVAVGFSSGATYDNGYNNVFVGANTDVTGAGFYNVIAIGQGTSVSSSSTALFGNAATGTYGGWANWTNVSDGRYKRNVKENVPGIDFINKLRPVTYNLDATGLDAFLHKNAKNELSGAAKAVYQKALQEKEKITYTGFIAQEVETAAKAIGFDFSGVDAAKNDNGTYGLRYAEFVVPLVKAVQELTAKNEQQQTMIEELKKAVEELKKR